MKKKIFKLIIISIPLFLVLALTSIIASSYFEHRNLIEEEKNKYPAPGVLVDVNDDGNYLHVYKKGQGNQTIVFMSGLGTSSPLYDFKVLSDKLSNDYKVLIIERAGYGWSDITKSPRDIDTVLEETRKALNISGEDSPFVLFPHSMAGLEAIHWANSYPDEVKAIIALDPLVPEYYEKTKHKTTFSKMTNFLVDTGLVRARPEVFDENFPAMKKGHLNEEEAQIARTIFYRRTQTKNMWEEIEMIKTNSKTVSEKGKPELPFHVFISNENDDEKWYETLIYYAQETDGKYFILEAGHYVHNYKPELIAEKSKELIG